MSNQTQDSRILKRRIIAYGTMALAAVLLILLIVLIAGALKKSPAQPSNPTATPTATAQATNTLQPTEPAVTQEPTETATVEPTATASQPETDMISKGNINLRAGAGTDTEQLAVIAKGEVVTVLEYTAGDEAWSKIRYDGKTGYVMTKFLAALPRAIDAAINVQESMRLRAEPNTTSDVLANLPANTKVTILQFVNSEWVKVRTETGTVGYCTLKYLKDIE